MYDNHSTGFIQRQASALSPHEYVADCEAAAMRGEIILSPANRPQLLALASARPDLSYMFWPGERRCKQEDLPADPHELTEELDDRDKTRVLYSLARDPEFRDRVRQMLGAC